MINPTSGVNAFPALNQISLQQNGIPSGVPATGAPSFSAMIQGSLAEINQTQMTASAAVEESLSGGDITQVEVFSAMKKADLSMRMLLQIRNKVMAAFNEIKQMQM